MRATYVSYYPDLAVPGATDAIQSFTDLAVTSGVKHLVLLSGRGEPEAQLCEDIVRKSGVEWTLLRASWFAQNFSEAHFLEPILTGEVALPVGNIGEPFVDADDIADATVATLAEDGHVGQLYELTGPRLSKPSFAPEFVDLIKYLFTEVFDGRNASMKDGVTRALGRPPRDFSDYPRETAATGVWNVGPQS